MKVSNAVALLGIIISLFAAPIFAREVIFNDAQNVSETIDCFYDINKNHPACVR